ncbi:MAG: polysaccharide export protein [Cocleimonas sp.]|nr:polysaccharide export protein [Cocleimonas sp.]
MKTLILTLAAKSRAILALVSISLLSACSSLSPQPPTAAETAMAARSVAVLNQAPVGAVPQYAVNDARVATKIAYRPAISATISPQDTLDINVFKVADLSAKALKVESNGAISLPLIGSVRVAGLSIGQAEQLITQKLSQYMQAPKVSVVRTDTAVSKRVTVEGEVRTPGVFPIKGNLSFLQAIAMAQGLTDLADSRSVLFFRDGQQHAVSLDLVRTGRIADPILRGDDRIVVLKDNAKVREKKVIDYLPAVIAPLSLFGVGG